MKPVRRITIISAALSLSLSALAQLPRTDNSMMFDYFLLTAASYAANQDYAKAYDSYATCLKINPKSAVAHYEMSRILEIAQRYEHAAEVASKAVELDSTGNDFYLRHAISVSKKAKKYNECIPFYDKRIALNTDDQHLLLDKAHFQWAYLEDYQGSIKTLDNVKASPSERLYWEAFKIKADDLYELGKVKKSFKMYDKLVSRPEATADDFYSYCLNLATEGQKKKDYSQAIEVCRKATQVEGGESYLEFLAELYVRSNKPLEARQTLKEYFSSPLVSLDEKRKTLYDYLSDEWKSQIAQEDNQLLESSFPSLKKQYPSSPEIWSIIQSFYDAWAMPDKGLATLEEYLATNQGDTYIWRTVLKYVSADLKYKDKVLPYSDRSISDVPGDWLLLLINGETRMISGKHLSAIPSLKEAYTILLNAEENKSNSQQIKETRISTLHNLANCYFYTDSLQQAYVIYDELLGLDPNDALALNNYAYYLAVNGKDLQKAEQMSSRSLKFEPNNTSYLDTYAYILYHNKSYSEALFVMERCLDIMNSTNQHISAEVLDHYADILYLNGRTDEAIKFWQKSLEEAKAEPQPYRDYDKLLSKVNSHKYIE